VADYVIPRDPGDGSLFQVSTANMVTKTGTGSVFFNGANTYVAITNIIGGT